MILFGASRFNNAQTLEWVRTMGNVSNEEVGNCIVLGKSGNIFVAGFFEGTLDFDPGPGVVDAVSKGWKDIFIQKLDSVGNLAWVRSVGAMEQEYQVSIVADTAEDLYVAGSFKGTADLDPGPGTINSISSGDYDVFIMKLNALGNLLWVKQIGGNLADGTTAIALDKSGNVLILGNYQQTVDFDPGSGVFNMTAPYSQTFILKLNSSGNFIWAKTIGDPIGRDIAVDLNESIYVVGDFYGTVDADPGPGVFHLTSADPTATSDAYILKLDRSGDFAWALSWGGRGTDDAWTVAVGTNQEIYIGGIFRDTTDIDPGAATASFISAGLTDRYILKLDSTGAFIWGNTLGSSSWDRVTDMRTDTNGNIYSTGFITGIVDVDPGSGIYNLGDPGDQFIYVQKLDTHGDFEWAVAFGGDFSGGRGQSIAVDLAGFVYATGAFIGPLVDFDPGQPSLIIPSFGNGNDIFTVKLSQQFALITGKILTESGSGIAGVTVTLSGDDNQVFVTANDGIYSFQVISGGDYTIAPEKNNDIVANNGLTALDILLMHKHTLGTSQLTSPYKRIAAAECNAQGDTAVSVLDIAYTRSLILGAAISFPPARLWQFVSTDHIFPDPTFPFPFENSRTFTHVFSDLTNQDFIGIKLGDVNDSWDPSIH